MAKFISIVIPVYNEQDSLKELVHRIQNTLTEINPSKSEMIFINDGSTDSSLEGLQKLTANNPDIKIISFKTNQGKGTALAYGFKQAAGDVIVTLDGDLQDNPENMPVLLKTLDDGYDLVIGWKKQRQDAFTRTFPSKIFNLILRTISGLQLHDFNSGFKVFKRAAIENLDTLEGRYRFIPLLVSKQGFKIGEVPVTHSPRRYGKSKYGWDRFFTTIIDLISIMNQKDHGSLKVLPTVEITYES